ncbi:MAG: extracellular solute-binding protein, partial [Chloroflexota bacterium]
TFEEWEALTMTDFELIAEWFTRPDEDLYGIAMQHSVVYDFYTMQLYPFMWSRGGEHWNEEERTMVGTLDTEVNAEAMEWNRRMLNYTPPGALSMGIGENVDAFTQGTVATSLQWAAVGLTMVTEENADSVAIVPPPAFEGPDGELSRVYSMGGQPWVLNAFNPADKMRVAVDFLNWWYLPETQLEFARRGGNPTVASTMNDPSFEDINPWNRAYKYMLEDGRARDFWHEPNYSEMLSLQQEEFTAYADGEYDDALSVLQFVACEQQEILFDNGRTDIEPPEECEDAEPE